jgi:hypothetical protein
MEIKVETIEELIEITVGLVKEGVNFKAFKEDGDWIIKFDGGY